MKNKLLVLLIISLMLTLSACSGVTKDTKNSGKFDQYRAGSYVEAMESGTFYMNFTDYIMGAEATIITAVDGNNNSVEVDSVGLPIRVLTLNGTIYYINDEEKKIFAVEGEVDENVFQPVAFDYSGITFLTEGKGVISALSGYDDNAYDYEEFSVGTGETEVMVRYYLKGDNLYVIQTNLGEVWQTMIINEFSKEIPDGLLEIPSGYKMVDAMGFYN